MVALVTGCSGLGRSVQVADSAQTSVPRTTSSAPAAGGSSESSTAASPPTAPPPVPAPAPAPPPLAPVSPNPLSTASLSIPAIGLADLPVVPYTGTPDDGPGTDIQNGGVGASPRGPGGGVGPGELGNYIVTAHRLSAGGPLRELPAVRDGDLVVVVVDGTVFEYAVTGTLEVSFRSEASKALQSAPVPGQPGVAPVQPMITLSTCATPEDRAAGNTWSDEFGNPEHRIDKIGVLVATRPA